MPRTNLSSRGRNLISTALLFPVLLVTSGCCFEWGSLWDDDDHHRDRHHESMRPRDHTGERYSDGGARDACKAPLPKR